MLRYFSARLEKDKREGMSSSLYATGGSLQNAQNVRNTQMYIEYSKSSSWHSSVGETSFSLRSVPLFCLYKNTNLS